MERTEIVSLFKNTPADGTEITVCGWAKNIRDSKNIGFIALSDGGCFKTLQVVLEAGKLANYDEVIHTGLYSSLRVKGKLVLTPQAKMCIRDRNSTASTPGTGGRWAAACCGSCWRPRACW